MKYLTSGLLTENESDRALLQPVLQNQLDSLALKGEFEAGTIQTSHVRAIDLTAHVDSAAAALLTFSELRKRYSGRQRIAELFGLLGQVDLAVLHQLPAYQTFLHDLTTALKELNFP